MKKKTLALLLSLTLAAGMIGGCGSKTETTTEENVQTAQTEAVAETGTETVSDQDAAGSCCCADRCNLRAGAHG